ncbi:hypothetical protein PHYSODRAFT_348425 [Phytophthora sojae]|uniref:Uncharacterized protein n=1 Tax=Phytophthora sojae (strain P6497) TaxID=1094619 RepID=G5AD58_PHYSP|nr:hypothetical protein PHYSODRAFT_348425 [Phytophthora sojae]EGZ06112.1 hypothetical protein PHYSODRAFT_348425 [Phytophthora sojae]|eukprot:XP_009538009.1 hypothetical protein PHYSODRAFT_348425 [Phytophthora sojae]
MATTSTGPRSPLSPTDLVVSPMEDMNVLQLMQEVQAAASKADGAEESKAEAKKRRHRENMARGRSRHNALMANMRKQYQHLHEKLETGMVAWRRRRAATSSSADAAASGPDGDEDGGYTSASSSSTTATVGMNRTELMAQYIEAVATENAIHKENEALAHRLEQMAIFETTLRVDTPEEVDPNLLKVDTELPACTVKALNRPGYWSYFAEDTEPFYYEPMAAATCYNLIREKYQTMKAHHAMFMKRHLIEQPVQFFGWTVQRYLSDRRKIEFHFTKRIPCTDSVALAEALAIDGWRIFNDPEMYRSCYRSPIDVRVLQRVDAFNTVLIRNSPDANRSHRFRHLNISSKVADEDEDGHKSLSILTLVVPPPDDLANTNRNGVVYLRDAYTYMRFDMFEDHVQFTYGGHGDCLNEAQARYLFVETGNVLFRFEQMIRRSNLVTLG